jgi:hypothetical protein
MKDFVIQRLAALATFEINLIQSRYRHPKYALVTHPDRHGTWIRRRAMRPACKLS